ncbi:hypothetical protein NDU88_003093 [Pleurodeles waltl]|uniref:Uncharacterized protein n=1 Tax=Pleurodeles waltl TaxID=8319 RepID=A0AAV7KUN6_PLEWA|nr:hypothetical protein NDU88_003093 [Pleurodeles waltl]
MEPLRELTRKGADFVWWEKQRVAFDVTKKGIANAPPLKPFNVTAQCIVTMDAGMNGLEGIVSECETGEEHMGDLVDVDFVAVVSDFMSDDFKMIDEKKWEESDREDSVL